MKDTVLQRVWWSIFLPQSAIAILNTTQGCARLRPASPTLLWEDGVQWVSVKSWWSRHLPLKKSLSYLLPTVTASRTRLKQASWALGASERSCQHKKGTVGFQGKQLVDGPAKEILESADQRKRVELLQRGNKVTRHRAKRSENPGPGLQSGGGQKEDRSSIDSVPAGPWFAADLKKGYILIKIICHSPKLMLVFLVEFVEDMWWPFWVLVYLFDLAS